MIGEFKNKVSYNENKYIMIQQLVLHNVREKSIPQSLKMQINSRRIGDGNKKRKTLKKHKKHKKKTIK